MNTIKVPAASTRKIEKNKRRDPVLVVANLREEERELIGWRGVRIPFRFNFSSDDQKK